MSQTKEERIKKAKSKLEIACSMFGWEEKDDTDRALHAKNFLEAYRAVEKLSIQNLGLNPDFELVMARVAATGLQKDYLEDTLNAVSYYIEKVERDKLKAIHNNKEETIKYATYIFNKITELYYAREERRKEPDKGLF
jgi:hypothetical protein